METRMTFLGGGLQRLAKTRVAVVGAGGGGSHIVQQLAHLGVGNIAIIDDDTLEYSNIERVVATDYRDLGRPKAQVLAARLSGLRSSIVPVRERVQSPRGCAYLRAADLVIGAVDGMRTRDYCERVCRTALVPYIDIGLSIVVRQGRVEGIGGQVFLSIPGGPCLRCVEILTEQVLAQDREEYAPGAPEQQVVSMNGLLASQAVTAALWLITGFEPRFPPPFYLSYDGLCHRLTPRGGVPTRCLHYNLESAGWAVVLPPKRNVA